MKQSLGGREADGQEAFQAAGIGVSLKRSLSAGNGLIPGDTGLLIRSQDEVKIPVTESKP